MNLAHLLARTARARPTRPAVFLGTHLLHDYATLAHRAATLARALQQRNLAAGDRVALFMTNHPACIEILFGCWWAGLTVVPINSKLHPREADYILGQSGTSLLFVTSDVGAALTRPCIDVESPAYAALLSASEPTEIVPRDPGDTAWLFYTSGTTGRPKGVMITHQNLLTMTLCYFADVDAADAQDAAIYAAPMSHGAGLYILPHVAAGARHVIPESHGFEADETYALASHHRNATMFAAPTIVKRLVDHAVEQGADPTGFKTIVYGGGPMYVNDIKRALAVMGPRFVQIYGQGESPMTITALSRADLVDATHPRHEARLASVGIAQTAMQARIADEDGRPLPIGATGEILAKGGAVMAGYWGDPDATERTLRDGWLATGDVGSLDDDGYLTLRDRSKDVIISGGSNIYPREVEEALLLHPAVAECSVVGRGHDEWGEEVVAFVVARPGAAIDTQALDTICLDHIARFKRPKAYVVLDALPKNNYGKVLKTELRERLRAEAPAPAAGPENTPTRARDRS